MVLRSHLLGLLLTFVCITSSSAQTRNLDLIPKPNKMLVHDGALNLNEVMPLYFHEGFEAIIPLLKNIPEIQLSTSEMVKRSSRRQRRQGVRILYALESDKLPEQGHKIVISENGILIKAHKPEYMIPAIQTLYQLRLLQGSNNPSLPFTVIEDHPRFAYRGMHLDVSSHFMPLNFIKKQLDLMALYKFNHFHWQLANGVGWRLESRQYPELTEKTAWRSHANLQEWKENGGQYLKKGHPNAYGGYYTKEEAREIVKYAAKLGITVTPEVDILSPTSELFTALPQLEPTSSETFAILKNILSELLEVFPSTYIHVGGNTIKKHQKAHRDTTFSLIAEYLQSRDRKIMTWNEISVPHKSASIMLQHDEEMGTNAGHDIVLSFPRLPHIDDHSADPRINRSVFEGYAPIPTIYEYDPVAPSIQKEKAKHILGIQGNLWTTNLPFPQQVEHIAFPRAIALAELGWTLQENRNYEDFKKRLQSHYSILQDRQVYYTRPSFHVDYDVLFDPKKLSNKVMLTSEQYEASIHYTTDGSEPSAKSTLYNLPIELSGTTTLKAASFIDTARAGSVETIQLDVHKAIGKRVKYNNPWNEKYPAQKEKTLTNGEKGGFDYQGGQWQGFANGLDVVIDLGRREEISSVSANFVEIPQAGIFFPDDLKVFVSENGKTFRQIGLISKLNGEDIHRPHNFRIALERSVMARYVKVVASNNEKGLLLVDEVVLY